MDSTFCRNSAILFTALWRRVRLVRCWTLLLPHHQTIPGFSRKAFGQEPDDIDTPAHRTAELYWCRESEAVTTASQNSVDLLRIAHCQRGSRDSCDKRVSSILSFLCCCFVSGKEPCNASRRSRNGSLSIKIGVPFFAGPSCARNLATSIFVVFSSPRGLLHFCTDARRLWRQTLHEDKPLDILSAYGCRAGLPS